jgi:multidrug efflux system membrane fusion protein
MAHLTARLGRWRRPVIGGIALLLAFVLYEVATTLVAYTGDAFVRSDLIALAPEVSGRIVTVHVRDNQAVRAGDPIASIDPTPFALAVAQKRAEIAEAEAQINADQDAIAAAQDEYRAAVAGVNLARTTQERMASLHARGNAPAQELDEAQATLQRGLAMQEAASAAIARAQAMAAAHQAALARLRTDLALAEWRLDRTRIVAPGDGIINNLMLRPGDTATAGVPLVGIVDATGWRVVANYREAHLSRLQAGQTVWVWLDSHPWRLFRGRIASITRGISRESGPEGLLPYVAPTTDWIRLQRRFPVTVVLQDPPAPLYMGSSARTLVFP